MAATRMARSLEQISCENLREMSSFGLIKSRLKDVLVAVYNYLKDSYKGIGAKLSISSQYCYNITRGTGFTLGGPVWRWETASPQCSAARKGWPGRAVGAPSTDTFKTWLDRA